MLNKFNRTVYKGRWGYHSVDYPTYLKMKTLYKIYWKCLSLKYALKRWERKIPKNRKGERPKHAVIHDLIINSGIHEEFQKS